MIKKKILIFFFFLVLARAVEVNIEKDIWDLAKSSQEINEGDGNEKIISILKSDEKVMMMFEKDSKNYIKVENKDYEVEFTDINNFYYLDSVYYICPKGEFQNFYKISNSVLQKVAFPPYFNDYINQAKKNNKNYDLNCFYHENYSGFIFLNFLRSQYSVIFDIKKSQITDVKMPENKYLESVSISEEQTTQEYDDREEKKSKSFNFVITERNEFKYAILEITYTIKKSDNGREINANLIKHESVRDNSNKEIHIYDNKVSMCTDKKKKVTYLFGYNSTTNEYEIIKANSINDEVKIEEGYNQKLPIHDQLGTNFKILDFQFLNECPYYYFKIQKENEVLWGQGDIAENQITFLSKEPIVSFHKDQNSKGGFVVKKNDNSFHYVCPLNLAGERKCEPCENYLLLNPSDHNICLTDKTNTSPEDSKYYVRCKDNFFLVDSVCETCENKGKYIIEDTTTKRACSCDEELYVIEPVENTDEYKCKLCSTTGEYKKRDENKCSERPENSYIFDKDKNVYELCDKNCKTCDGPSSNNCLSCEGYLGLVEDGSGLSCVNCKEKGLFKTKENDKCFTPESDKKYFTVSGGEDYGYIDYCHLNCDSCSSKGDDNDNKCTTCKTGLYGTYQKNQSGETHCVDANGCGSNLVADASQRKCINCAENQSQKKFKYEDGKECIEAPSVPFYIKDKDYGIIKNCGTSCKECTTAPTADNDNCSSCPENHFFNFGKTKCVDSCEAPYGINDDDKTSCVNCKEKGKYKYKDSQECIDLPTEETYYKITENKGFEDYGLIGHCYEKCLTCTAGPEENGSNQNCKKCIDGYGLEGTNCVKCTDGKGLYEGKCILCSSAKTDKNPEGLYKYENGEDCVSPDSPFCVVDKSKGIIRKCGEGCETCTVNQDSTKCTKCKEGYVLLTEGNCRSSCDDKGLMGLLNDACVNCRDKGKYKLLDGIYCQDMPSPNKDYFISNAEYNIIEKCDTSCDSCSGSSTKCASCASGKYLTEKNECLEDCGEFEEKNKEKNTCDHCSKLGKYLNNETKKCVSTPDGPFVVKNESEKVIEMCYKTCKSCSSKGDANSQNCLSCQNNYFFEPTTGACLDKCPENYGKENNECVNCASKKKFKYKDGDNCVRGRTENTPPKATTVTNSAFGIIEKCYSTCEDCSSPSTSETDQKCTSCLDGAEPQNGNCATLCQKSQKFYIESNVKHCVNECPAQKPLLVPSTLECVDSCINLLEYNSQCLESCPNGTKEKQGKCEKSDHNGKENTEDNGCITTKKDEESVKFSLTKSSINSELFNQIKDFVQENKRKKVNLISYSNVNISIFEDESCGYGAMDKYNLSYADLTSCVKTLRKEGVVGENERVITGIISVERKDSSSNQIEYYLGKETGEKIDMSKCKNVTVSYPLEDLFSEEQAKKIKYFLKLNIDITNPKDPFFNDFCYPYHDQNGRDVPLVDRRKVFYQNGSFCEEGCEGQKVNFKTAKIECDCKVKNSCLDSILDNIPFIDFPDGLSTVNLIVVRCYNLVFNVDYIKKNYGFWITIILFFFQFVSLGAFLSTGLQQIYTYLWKFSLDTSQKGKPASPVSKKKATQSTSFETLELTSPTFKLKANGKQRLKMLDDDSKTVSRSVVKSSTRIFKENENINSKSCDEKKRKESFNEEKEDFEPEELDELVFEDARTYDHRCFCNFYCRALKNNMILISVFTNMSVLDPIYIRIISLLLVITAYFGFNCLFFKEEYISNRFYEEDAETFFYVIKREVGKSILATCSSMIIQFIINYLLSGKKRLETLIKRELPNEEFLKKTKEIIKQIKIKICIFFIVDFILMSFFWYYISAFCAVYQKTQGAWLEGCIITFVCCFIFYAIIYFLVSVLRYIGLKCRISCLYTLSTYLI